MHTINIIIPATFSPRRQARALALFSSFTKTLGVEGRSSPADDQVIEITGLDEERFIEQIIDSYARCLLRTGER